MTLSTFRGRKLGGVRFSRSSESDSGRWGSLPVHGQLRHQRDVALYGRVLVLQEVQVHSVNRESLPAEVVALVVLVELLQSCLQLQTHRFL